MCSQVYTKGRFQDRANQSQCRGTSPGSDKRGNEIGFNLRMDTERNPRSRSETAVQENDEFKTKFLAACVSCSVFCLVALFVVSRAYIRSSLP